MSRALVLSTLLSLLLPFVQAQSLLDSLAMRYAGGGRTDYDKAQRLLDSLSHSFRWLATDYQRRSPEEIVVRGGGNCFDLALVYTDLIHRLGIRTRDIAEINLYEFSPQRQKTAEQKVRENGDRMSVFGERHNDHRWVEVWNEDINDWSPADPSMGVIGLEPWLKARVWFGERRTIDTSITNAMIVPFAIFVVDRPGVYGPSRARHYLVDAFDALYGGALSKLPSWKAWVDALGMLERPARAAFEGKENLHTHAAEIAALHAVFEKLRLEFETSRR